MDILFNKFDSHSAKIQLRKKLTDELSNLTEDQLNGTQIEDWMTYFKGQYLVEVPRILENQISVDVEDVKVNARNHRSRMQLGDFGGGYIPVDGIRATLHLPFEGDKTFFQCSGNVIWTMPIRGKISEAEITITHELIDHDSDGLNGKFDKSLNEIKSHLETLRNQFREFNDSIESIVAERLHHRLEKFKKDTELKAKLKFPIRKRDGAPETYKIPIRKKVLKPRQMPSAASGSPPDPELEMEHYSNILSIVKNMVLVMERSPTAFVGMDEEHLRQHFLVQLNAQYEGEGTGETFNAEGKTDILVRHQGHNLFIGECKFWKGPKAFLKTIDQLLRYVTWRDTKTALLIFNRGTELSVPLSKIPEVIQSHANFISVEKYGGETEFRYKFKNKNDEKKEFLLTVMVFDIPT